MHLIFTYFALMLGSGCVHVACSEEVDQMYNYDDYGTYDGYGDSDDFYGYGSTDKNIFRGFPFGISCSDAQEFSFPSYDQGLEDYGNATNETAQCIIWKNGVVIFNQTVDTSHLTDEGIFEKADESWDNAQINITLIYTNSSDSKSLLCVLNEPIAYNCSNPSVKPTGISATAGEPITLKCAHQHFDLHLTPDDSSSYTLWWYYGCQRIERNDRNYEYIHDYFRPGGIEGTEFAELQIVNASFSTTPGVYFCVLEKNEVDSNGSKINIHLSTEQVCVKRGRNQNEPEILISQEVYHVEPGSDLRMIAHGHTSTDEVSLSQTVEWKRVSGDELGQTLCSVFLVNSQSHYPDCTGYIHASEEHCEPVDDSEVQKEFTTDNFISSYWIRNATKDQHEGTYQVTLLTTKGHVADTYKVIVEEQAEEPYGLMIGLIVVGVLVVTALIVLVLLYKNRTDARYFYKKIFTGYCHTSKPMAFLIYSPDVRHEMGKALDIVTNFFGGRRFYDTNNIAGGVEDNPAGLLVHDHVCDMMKQCMRLMIFLTPNLLEANDDENFQIYQGFEDNIQQTLQVIFICTKEMKKKIFANEFGETTAIKNFMTKQKNFVIYWDEDNTAKFRRALYVALPKIPDGPVESQGRVV